MKIPFSRLLISVAVGMSASHGAFAGGTVAGVVPLDVPKPHPVSAGYKPKTVKPVENTEAPVAIVYLEGPSTAAAARANPPGKVQIRQRGYQFRPSFLPVQTGTKVEFPNQDEEFHNVFSYSKTKRFDLGRYRSDEPAKSVVFDKPGLSKIYCEIHQHMRCSVLVLDTPYFTTTDHTGRFRLTGIPAGEYTIKTMLPSEKVMQSKVTVTKGGTATVNFKR